MLFSEKRADRVYGLREGRLEGIVVKAAGLGHTCVSELRLLKEHERMDFASAVQQVLAATDDDQESIHPLTIVDVDHTLDRLVIMCPFSSRKLRASVGDVHGEPLDELMSIFRRLHSVEAKWLIRLLLKDLRPAEISTLLALRQFHFLMPDLLKIRTSLIDALELLNYDTIRRMPQFPTPDMEKQLKESALNEMQPRMGTMIGLQPFQKARSLKHCCQLAGDREVSVERKYDGEYCQIHVWKTGSDHRITIFSKSGRDSTVDRETLHDTIRQCLGIGTTRCKFKRQCVLTGELLVWSGVTGHVKSCRSTRSVDMFRARGANWDVIEIHLLAKMSI
jgi:DNA ligase-4